MEYAGAAPFFIVRLVVLATVAIAAQEQIDVVTMGPFSSDRTIGKYADKIWRSKPLDLAA